jgi:hypothetical protein
VILAGGVLVLFALSLAPTSFVSAGSKPSPAHSSAFGKSLEEWMLTYTSWALGGTKIAPDANNNAQAGHVVLLPLPSTPGDGTPGSLNVKLDSGQPFAMPLFQWLGNSYVDGSVDPMADVNDFRNMEITLKIDGQTVITTRNVMDYYTEGTFDPPITTDLPPGIGATAWVFAQSVGLVHPPLSPGKHTITLDESVSLADLGFPGPVVYHNTWNITVNRGK